MEEENSISSGDSGEEEEEEDFDKIYESHIEIKEEESFEAEAEVKSLPTDTEVSIEKQEVENFETFSDSNNFREWLSCYLNSFFFFTKLHQCDKGRMLSIILRLITFLKDTDGFWNEWITSNFRSFQILNWNQN